MNRKNFFKSLILGAGAVVAAPLVGQLGKVGQVIPGRMIGGSLATLRPMVGEINNLAAGQYVIPNAGKVILDLKSYEDPNQIRKEFYEWMQEVIWEGLAL